MQWLSAVKQEQLTACVYLRVHLSMRKVAGYSSLINLTGLNPVLSKAYSIMPAPLEF
jgi:hypothetical protein